MFRVTLTWDSVLRLINSTNLSHPVIQGDLWLMPQVGRQHDHNHNSGRWSRVSELSPGRQGCSIMLVVVLKCPNERHLRVPEVRAEASFTEHTNGN